MKNFRKSIIALATAAAMLIPSVAMAATITATVEDKAVAGNVYAGFYKGDVLVKAELGGTTEVKTETTTSGSTAEPEELTQPVVTGKIVSLDADASIYKLAFMAKGPVDMGAINVFDLTFSYDSSAVTPVSTAYGNEEVEGIEDGADIQEPFVVYNDPSGAEMSISGTKWIVGEGRTAVNVVGNVQGEAVISTDDFAFAEFYFKANGDLTADTFQLETDFDTFLGQMFADQNGASTAGVALSIAGGAWIGYGWGNTEKANTLTFAGFKLPAATTESVSAPVITTETALIAPASGVHKLVFKIQAPADTAEVEEATVSFSFDATKILPAKTDGTSYDLIAGGTFSNSNKKKTFGGYVNPVDPESEEGTAFEVKSASYAESDVEGIYTAEVTVGQQDVPLDITKEVVIAEFYYVVAEDAEVDEETFSFESIAAGDVEEATFNGFPWKAAETTTTTKTVITVNDVVAPADYDSIKVFVWDDKQIAQCAPVAGKLNYLKKTF